MRIGLQVGPINDGGSATAFDRINSLQINGFDYWNSRARLEVTRNRELLFEERERERETRRTTERRRVRDWIRVCPNGGEVR